MNAIASSELMHRLPLLLFLVALVRFVFSAAQWFCWERIGEKISYEVRKDLAAAYLHLDPTLRREREYQEIESGLAANFSNDIRLVREFVVHFFGGLPREGVQSVLLISILLSLNPKLFGIFAIGFVPIIAIVTEWGKKLRRRARVALRDFSGVSEWIQQRFLGIETIKHYRSEAFESASMAKHIDSLTYRLLKAARVKARTSPVIEAFSVVGAGSVIYLALRDIYQSHVPGAVQVTFFATLAVLGQNLSKLGKYINSNREGRAGSDRIFSALHSLRSSANVDLTGGFTFEATDRVYVEAIDVSARYPNRAELALSDISYHFEGGKIHCLCGPSGAGKSTLFQILLGTLRPQGGTVKIGLPKNAKIEDAISFLPQSAPLFPGTVLENVFWPHESGDKQRALECLREVGLTQLVSELPLHAETMVGESGRLLSGGQTQRLHLARVSYHAAQVYLIDEGTSALDPELEQLVFAMLKRLAQRGAVVIMIAHRLAAAGIADEILVLNGGRLTNVGKAEALKNVLEDLYR